MLIASTAATVVGKQHAPQGEKMSIPTGDNAFLHELELDVRAELTLIESSPPVEEAAGVPIDEWLSDPADDQRYEVNVRSLLEAVEVLEDGSRPGLCTETEGG